MPNPNELDEKTLEIKVRIASEQLDRNHFFNNARFLSDKHHHLSAQMAAFCQLVEQEFGLVYGVGEKARNILGMTNSSTRRKKEEDLNVYLADLLADRITAKLSKFVEYKGTKKDMDVDFKGTTNEFIERMLVDYCADINRQTRDELVVRTERDFFYVTKEFFSKIKNRTRQRNSVVESITSMLDSSGLVLPEENTVRLETSIEGGNGDCGYLVKDFPDDRYSDIGGLDEQLERVREVIELPITKPEKFKELGVKMPKGCIFFGHPGTAKTMMGRAIANETSSSFFYISGAELRRKYLGVGAGIIRTLYSEAFEKRPSIIFVDEVDAIVQSRGTDTGRYTEEQTNQLLTSIDGFKKLEGVATIFATNRPDLLDSAILDRFSTRYIIEFPLPDYEARKKIFRIKLAKMKLTETIDLDGVAEELAEATRESSGRDIDDILTQAGINAIKLDKNSISYENLMYGLQQEGFGNE